MKTLRIALATVLIISPGIALSASDGSLGATSSGSSVVTMTKQDAVQISGVDDIDLGIRGNIQAAETGSDDVCIFSSTGAYSVSVTSINGDTAGEFQLIDTNNTTVIPYSVDWIAASTRAVDYGVPVSGLIGNSTSIDCDSETNATFQITVAAADFNSAEPGDYRDTVTLLITPE